jgi:hypothetical protein
MMTENGCNPKKDLMVLFISYNKADIELFCEQAKNIQEHGKDAYNLSHASIMGIPFHGDLNEESGLLREYVHSQQPMFGQTGQFRDAFIW